ncbi:hypothetical protein [Nocardia sp. BMG51109]|uniref:hypothetical protein n=1 Tax=Nocardia sp. BMG51109 TaxID=1056816 RepID=UPI0004664176|nr:hypothetical protein [Nocardia sp. BMG51109]
MSPVSRGRKGRKNGKKQASAGREAEIVELSSEFDGSEADEEVDLEEIDLEVDELGLSEMMADAVATMGEFERVDDPADGEYLAATLLAVGYGGEPDEAAVFARMFITAAENVAQPGALAFLRCTAALSAEPIRAAAAEAADRLTAAGVGAPAWVAELDEPVVAGEYARWPQPDGDGEVLFGSFRRAGRTDGFMMFADDENCGAAWGLAPYVGSALDDARRLTDAEETEPQEPMPADEFRRRAEAALDARVLHDRIGIEPEAPEDDDAVPHEVTDVVLRARLRALPVSAKPLPVHIHPEYA